MTLLVPPLRDVTILQPTAAAFAIADIIANERSFCEERARIAGHCARLARVADAIIEKELARELDPTGCKQKRWSSRAVWALNRKISATMRRP